MKTQSYCGLHDKHNELPKGSVKFNDECMAICRDIQNTMALMMQKTCNIERTVDNMETIKPSLLNDS